ncbi:pirin-like C-terminal cupin domain-containing protein [Chryseolinea sp. T2]|uniref:pirin family protein n=1 Tax=Chryseolinea sp. T2 TaxID=3129255 RepID=UPI003076D8F6
MTIKRKAAWVYAPPSHPGFLGNGHIARPVIQSDYEHSDPFIILMDDMLDKKDDEPAGGPHPHAGFETVTLLLEGTLGDGPEAMTAGDFEMMTAGKGVVHTEVITKKEKFRLLQLWLNLPKKDRHALPRVQRMKGSHAPTRTVDGAAIRLYSGSFAGLSSPIKNYTPVIIATITLAPGATLTEAIPANFNSFLYVLDGDVRVGNESNVKTDEVAWLDLYDDESASQLEVTAGPQGAQFVLYGGLPQKHEIVSHGPFIADSLDEIKQLYADFRHGKMEHILEVAEDHKFAY